MNRITSRPFLKQLAEEHNLPLETVLKIIKSQFAFVAEKMGDSDLEGGEYNNIYLQNLGRFVVVPSARKKIKERLLLKKDGVNNVSKQKAGDITVCSDNK